MARHKRSKHRRFVLMERAVLTSLEWQALGHAEIIAYIYIKANYNGRNNGQIPLKYIDMKKIMAAATLSKALKGLESKGWIEKTKHGGMYRYYCLYKLTGKFDAI